MTCPCHKMIEVQKAELQKAFQEHKWYKSEKAGHDIGRKDAELDFIKNEMPTWGKRFRDKYCKQCKGLTTH